MKEISSAAEYAKLVIEVLMEADKELSSDEQMPSTLLQYLCEEVTTYSEVTWNSYILGTREFYQFTEEEMENLYEKAGLRYSQELLDGLVDKEIVEVVITEEGDVAYRLTEEGKHIASKLPK